MGRQKAFRSRREVTLTGKPVWFDAALARLNDDGYALIEGGVPADSCRRLADALAAAVPTARTQPDFHGRGWRVGHLNALTGPLGVSLHEAVAAAGFPALVAAMMGRPMRLMAVCSNLNLPGSRPQMLHIDGPFDRPFAIVNVALIETSVENGATELVAGSHAAPHRYWQLLRRAWRRRRVRPRLRAGDVLVRHSRLWHRALSNRTDRVRPVATLIYLSQEAERLDFQHPPDTGQVQLFGNGFTGRLGGAQEIVAARLPWLEHGIRLIRSLVR